jgi:hypothetical protein
MNQVVLLVALLVNPIGVGCKALGKHVVLSVPPCEGCEYVNIDIRSGGRQLEAVYAINNNWFYVWTTARRGTWTAETTDGRSVRGRWSRLKPFRWRY